MRFSHLIALSSLVRFAIGIALLVSIDLSDLARGESPSEPLSLVVMDPLAAPLSCPCVEGYAQRDYERFAVALAERLEREVTVTFAESLEKALQQSSCPRIDLVVGKDSVVRADARVLKQKFWPVAQLTGKDGKSSQTGLIVVPTGDPAQKVADLAGYRIIYGVPECEEKFAAARLLLTQSGISVPTPSETETSGACSDGATLILELGKDVRAATVISSYAAPLLEGCGTVKKGDLRVLATTAPVPFITFFLADEIPQKKREALAEAVIQTSRTPEMLIALESLLGFAPLSPEYLQHEEKAGSQAAPPEDVDAAKTSHSNSDLKAWPGWRGANRDGHSAWLPRDLPTDPTVLWQRQLTHEGLGGIAATDDCVIVGDRDFSNLLDEFHCFDAQTGDPKWFIRYPAPGRLDYDNSPRATPLITADRVYLFGAFGDLHCVDRQTGLIVWRKNILQEFAPDTDLIWGTCSSPLLVDEKLIVNPGGAASSFVALDAKNGSVVWQTAGGEFAFASPILAEYHGVPQIIAYDRQSLVGLDPATGTRLWTLVPPLEGDFNVSSPVAVNQQLVLTSENNRSRLHSFSVDGKIVPQPVATYQGLAPDMSTPVVVGTRLFCVSKKLYCLNLAQGLKEEWIGSDSAFGDYAPIIASDDRLLVIGRGGEMLLIDATADTFTIVSRFNPFHATAGSQATYAQPAVVGDKLYVRAGKNLACVSLAQ